MTGPDRAAGDDLTRRLLRAELRRVRATRTAAALVLAAAPLAAAAGALVALATTLTAREDLGPVALPPLQGLGAALGTQACTALAVCLGVVGATTEAGGRGAVATALTAPGRGGVLLARAAVHAGLGLAMGLVAVLAAVAAGSATAAALGGPAGLPPLGALAGWLAADVLALGLWAALGVGLGALVGRRLPGVAAALLLVWVVSPLLGLAGATVGRSGGPAVLAPTEAALALTRRRPLEALGRALADTVPGVTVDEAAWWWLGGVVLAAWVLAVGAAGWARSRRRDVR